MNIRRFVMLNPLLVQGSILLVEKSVPLNCKLLLVYPIQIILASQAPHVIVPSSVGLRYQVGLPSQVGLTRPLRLLRLVLNRVLIN